MNWDDLRVVAAINDRGSFAGAAQSLRIDETTVARKLGRLQAALGVVLFTAEDGRRRPTPQCQTILARIHDMERLADDIGRAAVADPEPGGHIRLAATPSVAEEILAPTLADLLDAYPRLSLELSTGTANVALERWEADLAIRLQRPERGNHAMVKLGDIGLYWVRPRDDQPRGHPPFRACVYPQELEGTPESRWLRQTQPDLPPQLVSANLRVIRAVLQSGRYSAILPDYLLGELGNDPRLSVTRLDIHREAWLLIQPHLQHNPAARAVADWVREVWRQRSYTSGI